MMSCLCCVSWFTNHSLGLMLGVCRLGTPRTAKSNTLSLCILIPFVAVDCESRRSMLTFKTIAPMLVLCQFYNISSGMTIVSTHCPRISPLLAVVPDSLAHQAHSGGIDRPAKCRRYTGSHNFPECSSIQPQPQVLPGMMLLIALRPVRVRGISLFFTFPAADTGRVSNLPSIFIVCNLFSAFGHLYAIH
ncbi:hypothetical protein B0H17DRAFT_1066875 [Mycena rosella]|uniref:Secreted protein n=1 Tax=Mycena rosella TaxID=1033263 RepID=A0AAD7GIB9_MYCRO|nr:hypothetical protein B0H17DRAFT_1066875 [Mycena rosella]